jgi:hypothetical protein
LVVVVPAPQVGCVVGFTPLAWSIANSRVSHTSGILPSVRECGYRICAALRGKAC